MTKDEISNNQSSARWSIDVDWYTQRGRSFPTLLQSCLCEDCRKKLSGEVAQPSDADLLKQLSKCCSHSPDFITGQTPILESIFRFLIASGNRPTIVEELGRQLSERRGGDISRTSPDVLLRLLKNDRYYGFHQAVD